MTISDMYLVVFQIILAVESEEIDRLIILKGRYNIGNVQLMWFVPSNLFCIVFVKLHALILFR